MRIYYKWLDSSNYVEIYTIHRILTDGTVIVKTPLGGHKHIDLFNDPKVLLVEVDD